MALGNFICGLIVAASFAALAGMVAGFSTLRTVLFVYSTIVLVQVAYALAITMIVLRKVHRSSSGAVKGHQRDTGGLA
ncbi:hypothetical protein [Wenxinia marina]|uniref:Uncharacterized protein n=1 Tax=Wenxinia marina DSM 24838 TaxID=1123501 RepID=A0A0D0QE47_9RHOB|nr:hypothetical protein [Wenxinia marina]KIQ69288.1 hypothetical protein Wenmar_02359 [Wenxinia marina DSM 24838]GGL71855.1 hypothetical protein GCM10011392_28050 [Wenxinia marina]